MVVDHLRRHIPEPLKSLIQPLPVRVGPADEAYADQLRKRLRALYVLHGRVTARGESWSIYPRVLEGPNESVTHYDKFTRDKTPARPSFGPFVSKLPPTIGVRDEEFPLEFCQDLEAVIQGLAGMAFATFGDHAAAIEALDRSLAKAQQSTNHQIDVLRVRRALSLAAIGQLDSAISSLRDRLELADPSPHLLRGLAYLLSDRAWNHQSTEADTDLDEARRHLHTALESATDPEMDTTAYNLVMLLPFDDPEKKRLVDRLLSRASSYRNLWYVRKLPADIAWSAYLEARKNGDEETAQHFARESAKWYSRMLRARPRIHFRGVRKRWPFLAVKTYPRSPILYANTKDGHAAAGHRVRARYFEWRFQRIRNRMLKLGDRHLRNAEWNLAYAHFDWASCVGRRDGTEYRAAAFAACCCWKGGRKEDGLAKWEKLAHDHPNCLVGRALMVRQLEELGLDTSVPGDEPSDIEETVDLIEARFPGWMWAGNGEFFPPDENGMNMPASSVSFGSGRTVP
jgi:tetratricopeptide (TPR) repeat protein